jgi:hypothetical protein
LDRLGGCRIRGPDLVAFGVLVKSGNNDPFPDSAARKNDREFILGGGGGV